MAATATPSGDTILCVDYDSQLFSSLFLLSTQLSSYLL